MNGTWQKRLVGIVLALTVAGGAWLWLRGIKPKSAAEPSAPQNDPRVATAPVVPESDLQSAARELAAARTSEERNTAQARLNKVLTASSTNEMRVAIRQLLDSNVDASTGQGFRIGAGGAMLETPTLRTW